MKDPGDIEANEIVDLYVKGYMEPTEVIDIGGNPITGADLRRNINRILSITFQQDTHIVDALSQKFNNSMLDDEKLACRLLLCHVNQLPLDQISIALRTLPDDQISALTEIYEEDLRVRNDSNSTIEEIDAAKLYARLVEDCKRPSLDVDPNPPSMTAESAVVSQDNRNTEQGIPAYRDHEGGPSETDASAPKRMSVLERLSKFMKKILKGRKRLSISTRGGATVVPSAKFEQFPLRSGERNSAGNDSSSREVREETNIDEILKALQTPGNNSGR